MKCILFHYILLTKNIPIRIYNINVQCTHHKVYFYFHTHTHLIHNNVHFLVSSFELHKMYFVYHSNYNKNRYFCASFPLQQKWIFLYVIYNLTKMSIFVSFQFLTKMQYILVSTSFLYKWIYFCLFNFHVTKIITLLFFQCQAKIIIFFISFNAKPKWSWLFRMSM